MSSYHKWKGFVRLPPVCVEEEPDNGHKDPRLGVTYQIPFPLMCERVAARDANQVLLYLLILAFPDICPTYGAVC